MASMLTRTAMRTAVRRPAAPAMARRNMSGDAEHAIEEMERWKKISAGMLVGSLVIGAIQFMGEGHHHHDAAEPLPSYRKIRNKPFPWSCSHCDLIDKECFRKCKAARSEA